MQRKFDMKKITALPVPEHLQTELDKVDWKNIKSAWGHCEELPAEINGLLSADAEVGIECENCIWQKMAYHGELFEATYATATIVARMLPFYQHAPIIERRLLGLLYKIMIQTGLRNHGYPEMIDSMKFLIPRLFEWAGGTNMVTARQAQHILIHVGKDLPQTGAFLQREWQQTAYPAIRRGYALYCLGWMYWLAEEEEVIKTYFLLAFDKERNVLLRVIQAIFLVRVSNDNVEDSWILEILNVLTRNDTTTLADLNSMQALIGQEDPVEFLINFLQNTHPAVLARHIRSLLTELPSHDHQYQETILLAISPILFSDVYINYTKVRTEGSRIALLALAELGEKDPDFLKRHSKLLVDLGLPSNTQQLKELATQ